MDKNDSQGLPIADEEEGVDVPVESAELSGPPVRRIFAQEFSGDLSQEAITLHLDGHIAAVIQQYKDANADGKVTVGEIFSVVGELAAASAFVIKAFLDVRTDETERGFDEIVTAAETAFDLNVVPIDFPPGPFIESYLEGQARAMIRPALTYLRDKIRTMPK